MVGRVALGVQRAGYLVVFLQQPTGAPALALIAVSTVLAWSLFFPATSTSPTARGDRRRHRGTGAAIAGWLVLAAATSSVGLAAGSAPPTGAYFTDSRAASLSFSVGCEDSHDHGNGPDNGAGHDKCHGNGHTKDRSDANK